MSCTPVLGLGRQSLQGCRSLSLSVILWCWIMEASILLFRSVRVGMTCLKLALGFFVTCSVEIIADNASSLTVAS